MSCSIDLTKWKINFLLEVFNCDPENAYCLAFTLDRLSQFFHRIDASNVEITSLLRENCRFTLESYGLKADNDLAGTTKLYHDDEPFIDLWQGSMLVERSTESFIRIINHLTGRVDSPHADIKLGFLWKFVEENDKSFETLSNFSLVCGQHTQAINITGFSFGNLINGTRFVEQFNSRGVVNDIQFHLKHTDELIELTLASLSSASAASGRKNYRLLFGYKSVKSVTLSKVGTEFQVYFHLSSAPRIYIQTDSLNPDIIDMKKTKFWSYNYNRRGYYQHCKHLTWTRWHSCDVVSSNTIGKCLTFSITCHENDISLINKFYVWRRYSSLEMFFGSVDVVKGQPRPVELISDFPFGVRYAFQCIDSISYSFQDDLITNNQFDAFIMFISRQIADGNTDWLITAMYRLCEDYLCGKVYFGLSRLKAIFKRIEKHWPSIYNLKNIENPKLKYLRRVILTPTRILILPEMPFQLCHFLEKAETDCVLRVLIRDENLGNLGFSVSRNEEDNDRQQKRKNDYERQAKLPSPEDYFLEKVLNERLLPSLDIAGKSYQIFSGSSSQLRGHGMVFYATDSRGYNATLMRSFFGDTGVPTEPSKYITRIGLSLSQVMGFVVLPNDTQVRYTKDILDGKHTVSSNPYNFTDGCGLISPQLAEYVYRDLKRQEIICFKPDEKEAITSAFQIRYLGCKGMLVVDSNLSGNVIVLRESMRKVDSRVDTLGIVKINEPRRAYLNKPLVTILNQIGLEDQFFVTLLTNAISDLIDSFRSNVGAAKALLMFSDLHRFIDLKKLTSLDYDLLGDPFFRSSVELVFHQGLDVIKQKARIPLDFNTSRTLFGVADPTATRRLPYVVVPTRRQEEPIKIYNGYDELICQYSTGPKNKLFFDRAVELELERNTKLIPHNGVLQYGEIFVFPSDFDKPLNRLVLVTKFPCMVAGDVQILRAVDRPELHSIRDCIVFPVHGYRPHPNEMAGSDLDGDEYCVIWSEKFVKLQMHMAMEFPDSKTHPSAPILVDNKEIINFYKRYLQECSIGRIASAHIVWADMLKLGIFSERCKNLAKKYSISLDFAKTGITQTLSKDERYRESPDFKQDWQLKSCYHSSRSLGTMYRTIAMFELFLSEETENLKKTLPIPDPRLEHPDWKKYKDVALKQYDIYCTIISHILEKSGFSDEAELYTEINERSTLFGGAEIKIDRRLVNHQENVIAVVTNLLVRPLEANFYEEFNSLYWKMRSRTQASLKEAYKAKVSAYYMVSMEKCKDAKKTFCGLPWIGKYSAHLLEMLREAGTSVDSERLKIIKRNRQPAPYGLAGDTICSRKTASDLCWTFLNKWLKEYLNAMNTSGLEAKRITDELRYQFDEIQEFYLSGARKSESPGSVIRQIFQRISSNQKTWDFKDNLFSACANPMGLMAVLIMERVYYEGTAARKMSDESNCCSNATYRVLKGSNDNADHSIPEFISMLKGISGCESIVYTPAPFNYDNYKLSVYGSRASILICQAIIGLHNRLASKNDHYSIRM